MSSLMRTQARVKKRKKQARNYSLVVNGVILGDNDDGDQ